MNEDLISTSGKTPGKNFLSFFLRLTIAKKMLLGYASLVFLLVMISLYSLLNLEKLTEINRSILEIDVPVIKAADAMVDIVLAQELYARRYMILRSPELLRIFWERDKEFDGWLVSLESMPNFPGFPLQHLQDLHKTYNDILVQGLDGNVGAGETAGQRFDKNVKDAQDAIVEALKGMGGMALADQNAKTLQTASLGTYALRIAWVLCFVGVIVSIAAATIITRNISGAINELRKATERISEGQFDYQPQISNKDELGDLAGAFVDMAGRLKRLEEMYLDASPLTHLPGGIAIENVLKKRFDNGVPFAFCLMDMDNFKAYNDRYGYAKGNTLIQALAGIIEKVVNEIGGKDDFVGHVGGDDFVVITAPDDFSRICNGVIADFDTAVPWFYDEFDRTRGCIEGVSRQGEHVSFPLATLSIAVVTSRREEVESHIRVGEIAAELKEYAKSIPGSLFVVDKRRDNANSRRVEGSGEGALREAARESDVV